MLGRGARKAAQATDGGWRGLKTEHQAYVELIKFAGVRPFERILIKRSCGCDFCIKEEPD